MRVALVQSHPVLGDLDANAAAAQEAIEEATAGGAGLVVFPELALTGYAVGEVDGDLTRRASDPVLLGLAAAAGDAGVLIGFHEDGGRSSYNAAAYYEGGRLVHVHRKLYLPAYAPFEERNHFTPGPRLRAFDARPDNIFTADALGWALYRAGDIQAAVPHMETAVRLGTADPGLRVRAATVFDAAGQPDRARQQLEAAFTMAPWTALPERDDAAALAERLGLSTPPAWTGR